MAENIPPEFSNVLNWSDDMRRWPNVMYGDIYNYFISSKAVDGQAMKNFKSLESYNYFQSGNVDCVYYGPCKDSDHVLLRAKVRASQTVSRISESFVECQVDGTIVKGWCTCMAGRGLSCSHVGALLWKVEHAVRNNMTGLSCTDDTNQWNKGTKRNIQPRPLGTIPFKKPKRGACGGVLPEDTFCKTDDVKQCRNDTPIYLSVEQFKEAVNNSPLLPLFNVKGTIINRSFCSNPPTRPLSNIIEEHGPHTSLTSCTKCSQFFGKYIDITVDQIDMLSQQTIEQSNCILWKDARKVRLTASCAHKVPVREETDPQKFVYEHLHPSFLGNSFTNHGIQAEICAKKFLVSQGYLLHETGMFVSAHEKWLSASPDGIIDDDTLLEVKSPVPNDKWNTLDELFANKKYDVVCDKGRYELKRNGSRGYYMQIQLTLFCCGLKKCKLFVWVSPNDWKVIDIDYDGVYVQGVVDRLRSFYAKKMLSRVVDEVEQNRLVLSHRFKTFMGMM